MDAYELIAEAITQYLIEKYNQNSSECFHSQRQAYFAILNVLRMLPLCRDPENFQWHFPSPSEYKPVSAGYRWEIKERLEELKAHYTKIYPHLESSKNLIQKTFQ